jgi:hypothetical protein
LVNINPAYRLAEVEFALNKVGCKALTAEQFKTSDYVGMLRELAPELDHSAPGRLTAGPGKVEHGFSGPTLVEAADRSDRGQLHLLATRQSDAAAGNELGLDTKKDIADGFLRLAGLPTFPLDRLVTIPEGVTRWGFTNRRRSDAVRRRRAYGDDAQPGGRAANGPRSRGAKPAYYC